MANACRAAWNGSAIVCSIWEPVSAIITIVTLWFDLIFRKIKDHILYPQTFRSTVIDERGSSPSVETSARVPEKTDRKSERKVSGEPALIIQHRDAANETVRSDGKRSDLMNVISAQSTIATNSLGNAGGGPGAVIKRTHPPLIRRTRTNFRPTSSSAPRHQRSTSSATASSSEPSIPKSVLLLREAIVRREINSLVDTLSKIDPPLLPLLLLEYPNQDGDNLIHASVAAAPSGAKPEFPPSALPPLPGKSNSLRIDWSEPTTMEGESEGQGPTQDLGVGKMSNEPLYYLLKALPESVRADAANRLNLEKGYAALHLATLRHNYYAAELLLEAGADPNVKSKKFYSTPLHVAVGQEDLKLSELLLRYGADPNAITRTGSLPLLTAVRKQSVGIVSVLLKAGGNPRHSVGEGQSAIALALELNAVQVLELMDKSVKQRGHRRTASLTTAVNPQINAS